MHNINKSRVSLLKQVAMWPSWIAELLKYPCDYRTDHYNPTCPGINSETSHANEGLCAYPAIPVKFHNCNDSVMRVVGNLRVPTKPQGTSCRKPRGSPWSSPLRLDGSRDDQVGEAVLVERSSEEAKSLKLRAKGLSGCHSSEQQPRQPDGGPEGQIKGLLSRHITKKKRAKGSSKLKH